MYFSDDKSADKSSLLRDTSVTADTCADKTLSAYQLRGHLFCVDNVESSPKARTFADTHFAAFGRAAIVAWRLWLGTQEAEATQLKSSCTIVYRLEDTNKVWPFGCCARKNRSDGYSCLKLRFAKATHKKS